MKKISFLFSMLAASFVAMTTTAANVTATPTADDDETQPYVEPAFTVYIDIDNADAVYFTINDVPVSHTSGENTVTVDPGDGYLKVHVNDGYAFTKFYDETKGSDFLQYDYQQMPVTIRKQMGLGDGAAAHLDGDTFTVKTVDLNQMTQFTLTVNVDNAAKCKATLGNTRDMNSSANRAIELHDGENIVTYTSIDTYIHFSGPSWLDPLESVTINGKSVADDGTMWKVYTIPLAGKAGSVIDIVTKPEPQEDQFSFIADIDDADYVKYFTRMPINRDIEFTSGPNVVTFNAGDYFEIWVYSPAATCTYNDEEVDFNSSYNRYHFYPTPGGTLKLQFGTSAVEAIEAENAAEAPIYDLNGRIVGTGANTLPAGVFIVNGKKIRIN